MKKLLGLSLAVALFASCSDDEGSSVSMSKLEGKWYPVSYKMEGVTVDYEHETCAKDYIEFAEGGVYKTYEVWSCDGNTVADFDTETGTYTTDGNKVTVAIDGDTSTISVKKLTESSLHVSYKMDMDEDGEDDMTVTEIYTSNP